MRPRCVCITLDGPLNDEVNQKFILRHGYSLRHDWKRVLYAEHTTMMVWLVQSILSLVVLSFETSPRKWHQETAIDVAFEVATGDNIS